MKKTGKGRKRRKGPAKRIRSLRRQVAELEKCEFRHRLAEKKLRKAYKTYRDTIEKAPFGVYIISKKGKVEYVNPAMLRIAGDPRKVFMGLDLLKLPPYKELGLSDKIRAGFKGKYFRMGPVKYTSYIGKKTTYRNFTGVPLEENGERKVLVFVQDVTGLKRTEEALRESEEKFRRFFENDPDYCYMISLEGKILDVNKVALKTLGYAKEEVLGRSLITTVYAPSSREKARKLFKRWKRKGKIENEELDIITRTGEKRTVLLNVNAVRGAGGKILHSISVQSDITERKKTEKALKESEQKFRDLTESISDWIWEVDKNGVYTYASPKVRDILGYEVDEVLGRTPFDFMLKEDAKKTSRFFREKAGKKVPFHGMENINRHKKGYLVVLETSGIPLFDEEGKLRGYRGIDRDITERKKAEEILRESEQRFRVICDNANIGMYVVDVETRETYMVNRKFCQMTGYSEREFKELKVEDIHAREDLPHALDQFEKLAGGKIMMSRNMPVKRKDGSIFYADINAAPIILGGKNYLLGFFNDVTERRRLEQLKDEFVNTVSHELRTPLAIIKESVFIAMSKLGKDISPEQKKFFDITRKNVERLDRLINDVLDYQKLVAGKMSFDMREWNINKLAGEIGREMSSLAEEKGIKLSVRLAKDLPELKFDTDRITQVLMNLVGNAIKFTDKGRVTIMTAKAAGGIRVSVKDTGVGIREKEKDKLFQSFTQLVDTRGGKTRGTGLGLVISKKIVEQHGGRIWGRSKYGEGSTFSFFLPAA